jgi:hypothetical protein
VPMMSSLSPGPMQVSVDALMDIAAALARLDAKFEQLAVAQKAMGDDIATLKRDVRHLMDWKQRVWGMALVLGLLPASVAYGWSLLSRQLVP